MTLADDPMERAEDPLALFDAWYAAARGCGIDKPHAAALATAGADCRATARIVLLSSHDARGFVFHTNYRSRKGRELEANPWATLLFWWDPLGRQVRIEGPCERTAPEESDAYWRSRPRGRQLGAWASEQSAVIAGPETLTRRMAEATRRFEGGEVPRPAHWGGYRLRPEVMEFWREGRDRLHDRVRFRREGGAWVREWLAP